MFSVSLQLSQNPEGHHKIIGQYLNLLSSVGPGVEAWLLWALEDWDVATWEVTNSPFLTFPLLCGRIFH